ncbi:MAG: hypothetical protein BroJett021_52430 [Chloroflexota bacterium]|nr:MAG: hypothetical protein BroJett021_52430 [Chloroflexota bacterium]
MDEKKYSAIKDAMRAAFPHARIAEHADGVRGIWKFQILRERGPSPMIGITDELIEDYESDDILKKLNEWQVFKLADDHAASLVLVTTKGPVIDDRT